MTESTKLKGSTPAGDTGFSPWQRLKTKRISYFTIPLLVMATVVEFVILATGWKYQQVVCLPQGMGVTFFHIGPIGATILAVELLKLPLAIWTASRQGWQKTFMLCVGLPLICVLTFQLVKDMAVYEMGVAMTPASQMLEKAEAEETKISQLNGELAAIERKRAEREHKLADLAAKQSKAKVELDDLLKRNDATRQDAISLTDYQKKELSEVESRQSTIIQQFNADAAQLNKELADLRARREIEVGRATKWNAEEARIENEYKAKKAEYDNKLAAYQKAKEDYDNANIVKRQFMHEPIHPGVAPERQANTILKSTLVTELDAQIAAKQAELVAVNNKRRDRVAQVEADARRLREEFDHRSVTKREESDRKREELSASLSALAKEEKSQRDLIDKEFEGVVQKRDSIQADLDAARKRAEGYYEERETAIRKTQVHRIATTVEIVRGLLKGERPMSIKMTAKERGDILTDQISMVRIWVYPVLAFIVAFLPTLMVEIGFSTVFHPEEQRPPHRLGFLGRRMHELYIRAGRQKVLRAERLAAGASAQIEQRDRALAKAKAAAESAIAERDSELATVRQALDAAFVAHEQELKEKELQRAEQNQAKEVEWVAKLAGLADTLNRTIQEKDALQDFQKSEIERQIQLRQNAWSDRVTALRKELDEQRTATETERVALMQEHHQKLMEVTEDCKTQVTQARRQMADAELAAMEKTAKLSHELKEALHARDEAEARVKHQAESFALQMSQTQEDTARQLEKAARQEKHRFERLQSDFEKALRQRGEDIEHKQALREQELTAGFEARLVEEKNKFEESARLRAAELARQFESRAAEQEARWKQEMLQKESAFQARLKQRDQETTLRVEARETELQNEFAAELRLREEEWGRQTDSKVRAAETRLGHEAQQKEELSQARARQRDQQWQAKLDELRADFQAQAKEIMRRHDTEMETALRDREAQLRKEMQHNEEDAGAKAKQRQDDLVAQLSAQAEFRLSAAHVQWEAEAEKKTRAVVEPLKVLLARAEKERDEARQSGFEAVRHVATLEKKLTEASTFLNGLRNGRQSEGNLSWRLEEKGEGRGSDAIEPS